MRNHFTLQKTYSISLRFKHESLRFRIFLIEDPFVKGLIQERTSMLTFPEVPSDFTNTVHISIEHTLADSRCRGILSSRKLASVFGFRISMLQQVD